MSDHSKSSSALDVGAQSETKSKTPEPHPNSVVKQEKSKIERESKEEKSNQEKKGKEDKKRTKKSNNKNENDIKKIGIMTCGGDCPGLNPVIRAVTVSAIQKYGWEVFGIEDSMQGLIDLDYKSPNGNMFLTIPQVDDIIGKGGTILGSDNCSDPFRFPVLNKDTGKVEEIDVSTNVLKNFKTLELDALVVIGGDGTMRISQKLRNLAKKDGWDFPIVGVPKTIDNDLYGTDYTFGFNTAVQTISKALDKIRDTARSHDRTVIVEVMGRDSGWLALYGGLSGSAHVILIPEIPYSVESIVNLLLDREEEGNPFCIIVIAEGAMPIGDEKSYTSERVPGAMPRYSGAGDKLQHNLLGYAKENNIKLRDIRVSVLGYIQRGGSPNNVDRILGSQLGSYVVTELIAKKKWGYMCALKTPDIISVPFEEISEKQKLVDPDCQLIQVAKDLGICVGV